MSSMLNRRGVRAFFRTLVILAVAVLVVASAAPSALAIQKKEPRPLNPGDGDGVNGYKTTALDGPSLSAGSETARENRWGGKDGLLAMDWASIQFYAYLLVRPLR